MRTYQSLYQNEVRAVELTIDDDTGTTWVPSAAYTKIERIDRKNYRGLQTTTEVVAEQAAMSQSNRVYTVVGTMVTSACGDYQLTWRIRKGRYTYYHVTDLEVFKP